MRMVLARLPRLLLVSVLFVALAAPAAAQSDFYRVDGLDIVAPDGMPEMAKGVGLGGWLLPEGYMFEMAGSWTDMREAFNEFLPLGEQDLIWEEFRARFVAEKDVQAIADWGFDHIRLPFHYQFFYDIDNRQFIEEGFEIVDEFLDWSENAGLGVILDMHAAPGAQSAGAIADSDGQARLWLEPIYGEVTVEIWEEFARRYKDDTRIIGYDLLNEPVTSDALCAPSGCTQEADEIRADSLRNLYVRITDAVRAHDTNHILFIEGDNFAKHFYKLEPAWDDQMVYAFHLYWTGANQGSINYLLDLRNRTQRPLWLGETGENSNPWYHAMAELSERHGFAYNFWTHKQLNANVPPVSSPKSQGFQNLLDYWYRGGQRPSDQAGRGAIWEMVYDLDLDSSRVNQDVLRALLDPDFGSTQTPYVDHRIPGVINAVHYDTGIIGQSYHDESFTESGGNTGTEYRNDGVDIEVSTDPLGYEYSVGWMEPGEWMEYTVAVDQTGVYDIDIRVASQVSGGRLTVSFDGQEVGFIDVTATGSWQNWTRKTISGVSLEAGTKVMRLTTGIRQRLTWVGGGDFNLNRLTFREASGVSVEEAVLPDEFGIAGLHPNPVASRATLRVDAPAPGSLGIEVFDLLGRRVWQTEVDVVGGSEAVELDLSGVAAGVYLLRVRHEGGGVDSRAVVVGR